MNIELEEFLDSLYPEVAESPIESVSQSRCSNVTNWETLEAVTFDNLESEPNSSISNLPDLETMETVTFEDFESVHYSKSSNFPSWETLEAVTFDNLESELNSSISNFPDLETMETVTFEDLESGYHSKSSEGSCCEIRETEEFDDLQNEHPSTSASTRTKVKKCSICEDWAIGNRYGVICCNPCKIFFRRSIVQNVNNKCRFNSKCVINKKTDRNCSYCRLQKCFKKGMKKELVKSYRTEKEICVVCGDSAIGNVYGVLSCQACYSFFQRTMTLKLSSFYSCKFVGNCSLTKKNKYNMCRYCRLQKCLNVGMREDMVGKNKKHGNLATDDQKE